MAIQKIKVKVPYYKRLRASSFHDVHDVTRFWVTVDIWYDDTWGTGGQARPVVLYSPGGGVREAFPLNHPAALKYVEAGMIYVVAYYNHWGSTDPDHTSTPPWNSGWNFYRRNFFSYAVRRAVNIQSALEFVVDKLGTLPEYTSKFRADTENIFGIGQSQGGSTYLVWSYLCNTRDYDYYNYGIRVKGIINSHGLAGTHSRGWYALDRMINMLGRAFTNGRHKFVHIYNDPDNFGGYDVAQRLRNAVSTAQRESHSFLNFMDLGHVQDFTFNVNYFKSVLRGDEIPVSEMSDGTPVAIINEYQIQVFTPGDFPNSMLDERYPPENPQT